MVNEGIMSLPGGMGIPAAQPAEQQPQTVSSADSYDAALTALNMTDPQQFEQFKQQLRQSLQGVEIPPEQLDTLIYILERLTETPEDYPEFARMANADGMEVPAEFDPEFVGALLVVFNEMRNMVSETLQDVMGIGPVVQGMEPAQFAKGGLADAAAYLQSKGRGEDRILAHITPGEAALLRRRGGAGTINPETGLPEYGWLSKAWKAVTGAVKSVVKGVVNVVKKVVQSPVGKILATVALATVLGPAGVGLSMGTAAGVASAGTTLMAGGSIKDALISGAMGYIGGGGTIMGVSPVSAVGQYLPGAAGGALNTGLSTGLISAGIGKIGGMSTQDALKLGLTSGATAAAMTGLKDTSLGRTGEEQAVRDDAFRRAMEGDQTAADMVRSGDYTGAIKAPGQVGTTGTAQDLLASNNQPYTGSGLKAPVMNPVSSYDAAGNFNPNYSLSSPSAPVPGMDGASGTGLRFGTAPITGAPGMGDALGTGIRAPISPLTTASGAANYSLSSVPSAAQPTGFIDKMVTGAKDLYNEYLSPSRPGLPADAGIIQKYGPLALAGTGVVAAMGGMEGEPANPNPAFDRAYTGSDYMRDNPDKFSGGLSSYTRPDQPASPIVPTPSYASIPVGQPGVVMPGGITQRPGGVAQPYNMAGLYGVPLIYGPDGQPRGYAKGGDAKPTHFPRRNGPISGPGTGTSDDIPAMLSDGEFVFTAKAVRNAGGGSRRKGAARMYKLMKKLEGGIVKG